MYSMWTAQGRRVVALADAIIGMYSALYLAVICVDMGMDEVMTNEDELRR